MKRLTAVGQRRCNRQRRGRMVGLDQFHHECPGLLMRFQRFRRLAHLRIRFSDTVVGPGQAILDRSIRGVGFGQFLADSQGFLVGRHCLGRLSHIRQRQAYGVVVQSQK